MLGQDFMRYAMAAAVLLGLVAPAVGFFLVHRRLSLVGDGIGHIAFAGLAVGYFLNLSPLWGALVAALAGAFLLEALRSRGRLASDQALALLFYAGIAVGVVLVSAAGQLNVNLFAFLFGSILTVGPADLGLIGLLALAGLAVILLLYRALAAATLDEEGARVSGVPVAWLNYLLAALAALTVAVGMRIVGILLVASLMVVPVMAGTAVAGSMRSALLLSMASGVISALGGLTAAYYGDLAPGAAIVLMAVLLYVVSSGLGRLRWSWGEAAGRGRGHKF